MKNITDKNGGILAILGRGALAIIVFALLFKIFLAFIAGVEGFNNENGMWVFLVIFTIPAIVVILISLADKLIGSRKKAVARLKENGIAVHKNNGHTLIKIRRDSGYLDRLRAYKVIIDEKAAGKIRNGEDVILEVPKGAHQMYLKIDWCRSNTVNFDAHDSTIKFGCGNNYHGFRTLLVLYLFYGLFFRDRYLWLKKDQ